MNNITPTKQTTCPNCGAASLSAFYEVQKVPVHSVLLLETLEEAVSYPRGDIRLGLCNACGFITNMAFDPGVHEYSAKYEATQGYSSTFNAFHQRLAQSLVDRYHLQGKSIIEIGCGQGEFLELLCKIGNNTGVGFDPAYVPERSQVKFNPNITFIQDFYSEKYAGYQADFICCKMTLEHIHQTASFLNTVRRSIGDRENTIIFFQVPNGRYVFGETAFWDIYYEHCSYFSKGSLARLFRKTGFEIIDLWTDYDDQYMMIEARPGGQREQPPLPQEESPAEMAKVVEDFRFNYARKTAAWQAQLRSAKENHQKIVLWGGGSKGVAFLTTLGITAAEIEYVVDINPHKAGTYMAGTGQKIVTPDSLLTYQPDTVIVMNPIYCREISLMLEQLGVNANLIGVDSIEG